MRLCLFLLLAGLLDAVLTHAGIALGLIEEGNPMMKFVIAKSWVGFYLIKICLPLALIALLNARPVKGLLRSLLISAAAIYFSVLCYHAVWIFLSFS
jgi:hypothetical protein